MICEHCRFLLSIKQPYWPKHSYNYYCAAAIDLNDLEYANKYKRDNNGQDINFIGSVIKLSPDWCPIKEGFVTEQQARTARIKVINYEEKICRITYPELEVVTQVKDV